MSDQELIQLIDKEVDFFRSVHEKSRSKVLDWVSEKKKTTEAMATLSKVLYHPTASEEEKEEAKRKLRLLKNHNATLKAPDELKDVYIELGDPVFHLEDDVCRKLSSVAMSYTQRLVRHPESQYAPDYQSNTTNWVSVDVSGLAQPRPGLPATSDPVPMSNQSNPVPPVWCGTGLCDKEPGQQNPPPSSTPESTQNPKPMCLECNTNRAEVHLGFYGDAECICLPCWAKKQSVKLAKNAKKIMKNVVGCSDALPLTTTLSRLINKAQAADATRILGKMSNDSTLPEEERKAAKRKLEVIQDFNTAIKLPSTWKEDDREKLEKTLLGVSTENNPFQAVDNILSKIPRRPTQPLEKKKQVPEDCMITEALQDASRAFSDTINTRTDAYLDQISQYIKRVTDAIPSKMKFEVDESVPNLRPQIICRLNLTDIIWDDLDSEARILAIAYLADHFNLGSDKRGDFIFRYVREDEYNQYAKKQEADLRKWDE